MELRILQQHEDKTNPLFASNNCQMLLQLYDDFYPKSGFYLPWVAYLIVKDDQVVGSCSFTGQPQDGKVEIAYWTFSPYEGQGIASYACKELINIAQSKDPGVMITAKTAPEKNASTTILERNNFVFSEIVQDHEIGDAWLWVHQKTD
jgi:RimJ/RimL family protein N-acetyltransferase